jgi:hypothetical protein
MEVALMVPRLDRQLLTASRDRRVSHRNPSAESSPLRHNYIPRLFHIYVMPRLWRERHSGIGFGGIIPNVKGPRKACPIAPLSLGCRSLVAYSEGGILHGTGE